MSSSKICTSDPGNFCSSQDVIVQKCPLGSYCPNKNMTEPQDCPEGYYCPNTFSQPIICPFGYYCPKICLREDYYPKICLREDYCSFCNTYFTM